MFGGNKKPVTFPGKDNALIVKASGTNFKKNQRIEVPKGYETILIEADGTSEAIKNQFDFRLETPVKYIYYAKSNQLKLSSKWGTRSRINVRTKDGNHKTLGAYGTMQFILANPIRYINHHMANKQSLDETDLTNTVLQKLPDIFTDLEETLSPIDETQTLSKTIKTHAFASLKHFLDESGITLEAFIIEDVNLKLVEE